MSGLPADKRFPRLAGSRVLRFAGAAVGLEWTDGTAAHLVDFLFGVAADPPTFEPGGEPDPIPAAWFRVESAGADELAIHGSQGETLRGAPSAVAFFFLERVAFHLADRGRGGLLLHAACVARAGRALLFPGGSGSGKSTLTCFLAGQGDSVLSDELTFIPSETLTCRGLRRPVCLKGGAAALFPELARQASASLELSAPAGLLVRFPQSVSEGGLKAFVFPRFSRTEPPAFQRLSGAEAALQLTGYAINARNLAQNGFPELLRLARGVPAYSLTYNDFATLRTAVDSAFA